MDATEKKPIEETTFLIRLLSDKGINNRFDFDHFKPRMPSANIAFAKCGAGPANFRFSNIAGSAWGWTVY
jgi:hypothetical protein